MVRPRFLNKEQNDGSQSLANCPLDMSYKLHPKFELYIRRAPVTLLSTLSNRRCQKRKNGFVAVSSFLRPARALVPRICEKRERDREILRCEVSIVLLLPPISFKSPFLPSPLSPFPFHMIYVRPTNARAAAACVKFVWPNPCLKI